MCSHWIQVLVICWIVHGNHREFGNKKLQLPSSLCSYLQLPTLQSFCWPLCMLPFSLSSAMLITCRHFLASRHRQPPMLSERERAIGEESSRFSPATNLRPRKSLGSPVALPQNKHWLNLSRPIKLSLQGLSLKPKSPTNQLLPNSINRTNTKH